MEAILVAVEDTSWRTLLVTAVAPIAWGTTYIVTESFLPPHRPLFSTLGLVAAVASVIVSALGFVMVKRWPAPTEMLTTISW
jgi:probable blue pigment (indigoidine) exporter